MQITIENEHASRTEAGSIAIKLEPKGSPEGWDTFATPENCWRSLKNIGTSEALVLLMTAGDGRKHVEWSDAIVQSARQLGTCLDADGYVGPNFFISRAQP